MRNCLVLGSGRSGTSMVAGTLAASGYRTGERLWPGGPANPRGFHEDREVNAINEALLATVLPWVPPGRLGMRMPGRLGHLQRWLAPIPLDRAVRTTPRIDRRIAAVVARTPYALKDPRFCTTLSAWRPHLAPDTGFVVVFREPARTVTSLLREVDQARYLRGVDLDRERAEALWRLNYQRVLARATDEGDRWLFLHYDQVLEGSGLGRLGEFLGAELVADFLDAGLRRSTDELLVTDETAAVYAELCQRAEHHHVH
ncbi:MAG: sulfotransferase [Acidimicrobiia bacterium]|nr:sulfotransferase [Acidimicrobiia bacterium]